MTVTDAKVQLVLPVGATNIRKKNGTVPTVRFIPVGPNLLTNGDFETDTSGWTLKNGSTLARDTVTFKVGVASLKITRGTADISAGLTTRVGVTPGTRYEAAGWVHAGATSGARLRLKWYDAAGAALTSVASTLSALNGWAVAQVVSDAPFDAVTADLELEVDSAGDGYFDGLSLRPCLPVAESPYAEPATAGTLAGGGIVAVPAPGVVQFAGDVKVFDMGAQTNVTLAESSYTRVRNAQHMFTGDVLVDTGLMRVLFSRGVTTSRVRVYPYADGKLQSNINVDLDTGGDSAATIQTVKLLLVSGARVIARVVDSVGNHAVLTFQRGRYGFRVDTSRVVSVTTSRQDFELSLAGDRWQLYNENVVIADNDLQGNVNITGSTLTSPYALVVDDAVPYVIALSMTKKPSSQLSAVGTVMRWRDAAATVAPFERTFWVNVIPWSWARNGYWHREAADAANTFVGGSNVADATGAVGGTVRRLSANGDSVDYSLLAGRDIPLGEYAVVVYMKDSAAVSNDVTVSVVNTTDSTTPATQAMTLTTSYAHRVLNFALILTDDADNIRLRVAKSTATANDIDVGYFVLIPIKRNTATPAFVFFPRDVGRDVLMVTTEKQGVAAS